jgi:plasmid stability protein
MPNFTVRNIPKEDYAELQQDAMKNRRSVNSEVLRILADKAEMNRRRRQASKVLTRLDRIRKEIAREHPNQPDSVDLIREDRDSR